MTHVSSYAHGVPSFTDLATPDPDASQRFYGALFGWDFDTRPAGPDATYTMCSKDGKVAAGMMQLSPEMAQSGMPPVWSSYVTVDDLEAATAKVAPAGGQVMRPPMDVMDAGRMAVVTDSAGAVFCLWEAGESIGSEVVNEHGAVTWNELLTPDPAQAAGFYGELLGWTAQTMPMPMGDYTVFFVEGGNENGIAGSMTPPMPGMPPAWLVYFNVDDCDATAELATEHGATVMGQPMDVPGVGRLVPIQDPQGAMFAVMTPASGE